MIRLHVCLNGTKENPWHEMGLTQNPFPQIGIHEWAGLCLALQSLGGDPIPSTDYIREALQGFSQEFIDLACSRFVPGQYVEFDAIWEESS